MNVPLKETWINPKIEIRTTGQKGKGMFALQLIKNDEIILIWGGEYTNKVGAKKAIRQGRLVMQWDEDLFSVEDRGDDLGYYINHSCDSNTWMLGPFTLVAKKSIEPGEEITADYALWESDPSFVAKWKCQCGSKKCRGNITGTDWKIPVIQERYKNHFSPLINKLIKKSKS